ncbi:HET-domain-containing protein, partial [Stipitochalara longipes BDJ]
MRSIATRFSGTPHICLIRILTVSPEVLLIYWFLREYLRSTRKMRLLKRDSNGEFSLTKDLVRDIPAYAILSHTWGDDDQEVTYEDLVEGLGKSKAGYQKIRFCGEQAARDSLGYFWVDTCCIDKTDAVELQRSINSMFRWYKNAVKCYVYLSDVSIPEDKVGNDFNLDVESFFRTARWFSRGWTLQELLAPSSVEFFSANYKRLGDKLSLERLIHEITGIPVEALRGYDLTKFSVDERVSWAAKRETKHEEDMAYSLFGFFGIFLPLLYGEGRENAFRRLREEVNKSVKSHEFDELGAQNQPKFTAHENRNLQTSSGFPARELRRDGFNIKFHFANVPSIHHFEGRETYLQHLADTLLPESNPYQRKLEIISGLGGIGKTQLAVQFVKSHEDKFSSTFFIDAHSQESVSRTFLGIHVLLWGDCSKEASGMVDERKVLDTHMIREVLDWFCLDGNTRWLLIFDNVDRQPSDPDGIDITAFFPPINRGSILITTRLNPLEVYRLSKPQIVLQPMRHDESSSLLHYYMKMMPNNSSMASISYPETREQQDSLLNRLAGLPLALAQAGSFLRTTRMNIAQYLDLYDNSRRQLLESHRPLFGRGEDNPRGSVWTTWSMSISLLHDMTQRAGSGNQYKNALKLLQLITYFEPTDIDFAILRRGLIGNDVPQWFEEVFENELSFITTAEILVERSLLNGTAKYGTFSMHRVVYDWLCAFDENDVDEQLLSLAMCAIAFSAPGQRGLNWKEDEKRLIIHALAMENRLLRCKFVSGVPMVDLGTFTPTQRQRALLLVRDPGWYKELNNTLQPLAAISYLFSVFEKTQTGLNVVDAALARSEQGNGVKNTQVYVALLHFKATIFLHQGSFEPARSCLRRAADLARPHGLQDDLREVELLQALITRKEGNPRLAMQMLTRLVQDCKSAGLGLYHPSRISAVISLDHVMEILTGGKYENIALDIANERVRLLEPYRPEIEKRALHDSTARWMLSSLGQAYYR